MELIMNILVKTGAAIRISTKACLAIWCWVIRSCSSWNIRWTGSIKSIIIRLLIEMNKIRYLSNMIYNWFWLFFQIETSRLLWILDCRVNKNNNMTKLICIKLYFEITIIRYYQPFFNVTSVEVKKRLINVFIPTKPEF